MPVFSKAAARASGGGGVTTADNGLSINPVGNVTIAGGVTDILQSWRITVLDNNSSFFIRKNASGGNQTFFEINDIGNLLIGKSGPSSNLFSVVMPSIVIRANNDINILSDETTNATFLIAKQNRYEIRGGISNNDLSIRSFGPSGIIRIFTNTFGASNGRIDLSESNGVLIRSLNSAMSSNTTFAISTLIGPIVFTAKTSSTGQPCFIRLANVSNQIDILSPNGSSTTIGVGTGVGVDEGSKLTINQLQANLFHVAGSVFMYTGIFNTIGLSQSRFAATQTSAEISTTGFRNIIMQSGNDLFLTVPNAIGRAVTIGGATSNSSVIINLNGTPKINAFDNAARTPVTNRYWPVFGPDGLLYYIPLFQ